jgi:hypothetical protein
MDRTIISNPGESVRWKTSRRKWLESCSDPLCLIAMIDEATGRTVARFTCDDSIDENFRTLSAYITRWGHPHRVRTDKSKLFAEGGQIRRALTELNIQWTPSGSPRDLGGAEPFFMEVWANLTRELQSAGAGSFEDAAAYLENTLLPRWNADLIPQISSDRSAPPSIQHDLGSILSTVHPRKVSRQGAIRFNHNLYRVSTSPVGTSLRGQEVRIETHADGRIFARWNGSYVELEKLGENSQPTSRAPSQAPRKPRFSNRSWMKGFFDKPGVPIWRAFR